MNGKKLEKLRTKNGFSREELAEILCENTSTIQSWEQGWYVNGPTTSDMEDMAEVFDMSIEKLREYIDQDEDDDFDSDEDDMGLGEYTARMAFNTAKVLFKEYMKSDK